MDKLNLYLKLLQSSKENVEMKSLLKNISNVISVIKPRRIVEHEEVMKKIESYLDEIFWTRKVKTKWHPPEGFFTRTAEKIAKGLKAASDDLQTAMGRLNFYINRAGKNLPPEDRKKLELAKDKLSNLYPKKKED